MNVKGRKQPVNKSESLPTKTVCGREMTGDVAWYPHARYQNETIYFCTEFCLDAFNADPERFYNAHSRNKDQHAED
jgi:YHS domain-containing protein